MAVICTPGVRRIAIAKGAVDDPNRDSRRVHKAPLPRWGGVGIYLGIVVAVLTLIPIGPSYPLFIAAMLGVGGVLVWVGALDDLHQFSARAQFYLLLAAALGVQFIFDKSGRIQGGQTWPIVLATLATLFTIFVITKTMDTIDGVDGLASGLSAISGVTLCILGTYAGSPYVPLVAAAVAGAAMGFLPHNYNPSRIIMGTGGAYILGFTLACLCIVGAMETPGILGYSAPLFVFFVPLFDAAQVMIKRYRAGDPLTSPDKRHIHHMLLQRGLNQRQTVGVLYTVAASVCAIYVALVVNS